MQLILSDFRILRPKYEIPQEDGLNWIALAHSYSKFIETSINKVNKPIPEIHKQMTNIVNRFACKPDKISNRGTSISDYSHQEWENMLLFDFKNSFTGAAIGERMKLFTQIVEEVFESFYLHYNQNTPPKHLIHVSCTGYSSPSAAQKLIATKDWGEHTKVTHAYHMGCYAALPALRIANGFLREEKGNSIELNSDPYLGRVDIVHTELCTLHFNPALHDPSQFVVQSLFADGYIAYSMFDNLSFQKTKDEVAFELLAQHEVIIPHTKDAMSWDVSESGFLMTLSGKVPGIIAENIEKFLQKMSEKISCNFADIKETAIFAIHPGGPKIIQYIQEILKISTQAISYSEHILRQYGNMSSATLPHIWQNILQDYPAKNTLVISLAFGPGLTVSGSIMRVI